MTALILVALLLLVAPGSQLVEAGEENFITNQSSFETLTAAASCPGCDSATLVISPGSFGYYSADYSDYNGVVQIDLTIGTGQPGTVFIGTDQSIVALDNYDQTGLEIFAVVHGKRVVTEGGVLATIFPQ